MTDDKNSPTDKIVGSTDWLGCTKQRRNDADWKGMNEKRVNWRTLRREWGRMCYRTNHLGEQLEAWWEPETGERPNAEVSRDDK